MADPNMIRALDLIWHTQLWHYVFVCLVLIVGAFMQWMGYKLFAMGFFGRGKDAGGKVEAVFKDWKITFKRAAPGTFFVVCGTSLMGFAIFQAGSDFNYTGSGYAPPTGSGFTKLLPLTQETDQLIQKALRGQLLSESEKIQAAAFADQVQACPAAKPPGKADK